MHKYATFEKELRYYIPECRGKRNRKNIILMIDCDWSISTVHPEIAIENHKQLLEDGYKLLRQESPVINNNNEIIFHYTSTNYRDWCKA